jgi:hypothetical protein
MNARERLILAYAPSRWSGRSLLPLMKPRGFGGTPPLRGGFTSSLPRLARVRRAPAK